MSSVSPIRLAVGLGGSSFKSSSSQSATFSMLSGDKSPFGGFVQSKFFDEIAIDLFAQSLLILPAVLLPNKISEQEGTNEQYDGKDGVHITKKVL